MIGDWDEMSFWQSGEWQVIDERLSDLDKKKITYNPDRSLLFTALDATPMQKVKVCILGQDPYPDHNLATGLAFSVPKGAKIPPSLNNILVEYSKDLGLKFPSSGDLTPWAEQGVLLWNTIPSCLEGKPGSHKNWFEWDFLTREIVETLSEKGIVFGLLGSFAKAYKRFIDQDANDIVETAHPSPLAARNKNIDHPFLGSRLFSTINLRLKEMGQEPVDWRLQ